MFFQSFNNFTAPEVNGAFASRGIQPSTGFITFSVGDVVGNESYITKNEDGDNVTVTVENGIAFFSHPQSHQMVGIGDVVVTDGPSTFYLSEKITPKVWKVTDNQGKRPSGITDEVVTSIDKVFATVSAAINGATSGAETLMGLTSPQDLTAVNMTLRIVAYEKSSVEDVGTGTIDITGWTTSGDHYIHVFTPRDVMTQCNNIALRHNGDPAGVGYKMQKTAASATIIFDLSSEYTVVEGFIIDGQAEGTIVRMNADYCEVNNNILLDAYWGIDSTSYDYGIARSNFIARMFITGIQDNNGRCNSINNTIYSCNIGIASNASATIGGWIINNIIQDSTTSITNPTNARLFNTITDDTYASGGTDCISNTTVILEDTGSDIYRLTYRSGDALKEGLVSKDIYNSRDALSFDIDGTNNKIAGPVRCVGAHFFVKELFIAISLPADGVEDRITGTPDISIADGLLTFTEAQTDFSICSGFKIFTSGPDYLLHTKVSDTQWYVTNLDGSVPADVAGPVAVDSIEAPFDNLHEAFDSGLEDDYLGVKSLVDEGSETYVRVTMMLSCNSIHGSTIDNDWVVDEAHYIKITTPTDSSQCNTDRRHNGYLEKDNNHTTMVAPLKPFIVSHGDGGYALNIAASYTRVEHSQMSSFGSACVRIYGGHDQRVFGNILYDSSGDGVVFESDEPHKTAVVAENILFNMDNNGIDIKHDLGTRAVGQWADGATKFRITAINKGTSINGNIVRVVKSADVTYPSFVWRRDELIIFVNDITSYQAIDALDGNQIVIGEPWGVYYSGDDISDTGLLWEFEGRISEANDSYTTGSHGESDSHVCVYNNTVYNCGNIGVKMETRPDLPFTNEIRLINNLVEKSGKQDYFSSRGKCPHILSEGNRSSDESILRLSGERDHSGWTTEFRDKFYGDFRISLYSQLLMDDASQMWADPLFPINEDVNGDSWEDYKWNAGADCWAPATLPKTLHFSVGSDSSDLDGGSGRNITILNGVLTFDGSGINSSIGVGDRVIHASGTCYLAERGSSLSWHVVDDEGAVPADVSSPSALTSVTRVSNDLNSAIDGGAANDINDEIGFGSPRNLASNGCKLKVWFYNDGDTPDDGNFTISGWTTDVDHKLEVLTPYNVNTQCPNRQRHYGYWAGGGARILANNANCVDIDNPYAIIDGFMIDGDGVALNGIDLSVGHIGSAAYRNIVKDVTGIGIAAADDVDTNYKFIMFNTVYDTGTIGIDGGDYSAVVLHNTVVRAGTKGIQYPLWCDENIVQDSVAGVDIDSLNKVSKCIISDNNAPGTFDGSYDNTSLIFNDKDNEDFRLSRSDYLAVRSGDTFPSFKLEWGYQYNLPEGLDVVGNLIENVPIGAHSLTDDEFQVRDMFFSCGTNDSELNEGVPLTVEIVGGVATFYVGSTEREQDGDNIGVGNELNYDTDKFCYFYRRITNSSWMVKDKYGADPDDTIGDVSVEYIKHPFNDLAAVFSTGANSLGELIGDSNNPFTNLSRPKFFINIPVYKHTVYQTNKVTISGFVNDEENYLRVYVPYDTVNECVERQRHMGFYDPSPSVKKVLLQSPAPIGGPMVLLSSRHTMFEGFLINGMLESDGIVISEERNATVYNNIIVHAVNGITVMQGDYFYDNFEDGVKNAEWGDDFQDPDWPLYDNGDGTYSAVKGSNGLVDLLNQDAPNQFSGNFDFEVGIRVNDSDAANTSVKLGVEDVNTSPPGSSTTDLWMGWWIHDNSESLVNVNFTTPVAERPNLPAVNGRSYRLRMVRGGTLTPEGVFTPGGSSSAVRFYWFDDFSDGSGNNTQTWIEHAHSPITWAADPFYFMIDGASLVGFNYLKVWAENNLATSPVKNPYTSKIVNNIISGAHILAPGFTQDGITSGGNDIVLNNTVDDISGTAYVNTDTDILKNNIAGDAATGFDDNSNIEYCISEDSSAGTDNHNRQETVLFQDSVNFKYFLDKDDSAARGFGKNLKNFSGFPFNIDINDVERGRIWDVGALEHVPEYRVCYGVGNSYSDVGTRVLSPTLTYTISTVNGENIITFSEAQTHVGFGIGIEIIDNSNPFPNRCLLLEKIDELNYKVTDSWGYLIEDAAERITPQLASSVVRPFSNLANAMDGNYGAFSAFYFGSYDLVTYSTLVKVVCYDSNVAEGNCEVPSITTDVDYFLRIFTPSDVLKECNLSQRHYGVLPSGGVIYAITPSSGDESCVDIGSADYTELEGFYLISNTCDYGVKTDEAKNFFISKNIIRESIKHGIYAKMDASEVGGDGPYTIDVIVNNVIFGCGGSGIWAGAKFLYSSRSELYVYNNTIVGCFHGLFYQKDSWTGAKCVAIGNICQDSIASDFGSDLAEHSGSFYLYANISSDDSSTYYFGLRNYINTPITFINKPLNCRLSTIYDDLAIDDSNDLTDNVAYPFDFDIGGLDREEDQWDIGAFEVNEIDGGGDLLVGPVGIGLTAAIVSDDIPVKDIYIRDEEAPHVGDNNWFPSIAAMNAFLADPEYVTYDNFDLHIYIEGNNSFDGEMALRDRGIRSVYVETDPVERHLGPGTIEYDANLLDDVSSQALIEFKNLKIKSHADQNGDYLLSNSAATTNIRLVNSIVQVNNDALVDTIPCQIEVINSLLIYRNDGDSSTLRLNNNSTIGSSIVNSGVLSYYATNLTFITTDGVSDDLVRNLLTYNYGSGNLSLSNTNEVNSILNTNPKFMEATLASQDFDIDETMAYNFIPLKTSKMIDAGDNAFVSDIPVDIIGSVRIFGSLTVDIGPYEVEVNKLLFSSERIVQVFQDKLNLNFQTKTYSSTSDDIIYRDLYDQFEDDKCKSQEFVRDSKVVIRLREQTDDYLVFSDKENDLIKKFEAYYDSSSRSIIITNGIDLFGGLFKNIFDDGRYVFYFDESQHTLKVYTNKTYDKGLSGTNNLVRNVKFGGPSIPSN